MLRIAFLGDSITDFGDRRLNFSTWVSKALGDAARVFNLGEGETGITGDAPRLQDQPEWERLADVEPDLVWIMVGGNDIAAGARTPAYRRALRAVVEEVQALPSEPVVIVAAQPPFFAGRFDEEPGIDAELLHGTFRDDWAPAMRRVAEATGARFVDIGAAAPDYPVNYPVTLHPNAVAAQTLASLIVPEIRDAAGFAGPFARLGIKGRAQADLVRGVASDEVILGRGGTDTLSGNRGDDRLLGGRRADRLSGGPGDDVLHGGSGSDRMRGGLGADRFVPGPGAGDLIIDFEHGRDRINLRVWTVEGIEDLALRRDGAGGLVATDLSDAARATFQVASDAMLRPSHLEADDFLF